MTGVSDERSTVRCAVAAPPLFLVGAERSGTTLLRLMLDHHPQLAWLQEFEYAVDLVSDDGRWPDLARYRAHLEVDRIFRARGFAVDAVLDYPALVRDFLEQRRRRANKPIAGATVHRHFDRLLHIWPDAHFIHIFRDGRDVARSNVGMGWAGNAYFGATRWIDAERLWDRVAARLPAGRYLNVRQEDLIRQTQSTLTRICAFIGVPYDDAMLDYAGKSSYERPDPRLVEQWRRKARPAEIRAIESRCAELLAARGYEPSGLPPLTIGPLRSLWLRISDRWGVMRFRQRRYGLGLWLAAAIAPRLGARQWERNLRLRINAIDEQHLQ